MCVSCERVCVLSVCVCVYVCVCVCVCVCMNVYVCIYTYLVEAVCVTAEVVIHDAVISCCTLCNTSASILKMNTL